MQGWENEFIDFLMGRQTDDLTTMQMNFCGGSFSQGNEDIFHENTVTNACKAVDMTNMQPS